MPVRNYNTSTLIYQPVPSTGDAFFLRYSLSLKQISTTLYKYTKNNSTTLQLSSHITSNHAAQSHFLQTNSLLYSFHQQATHHVFPPDKWATKQPLWVRSVGRAERRENYQLSTAGWLKFHCYRLYKRQIRIWPLQSKTAQWINYIIYEHLKKIHSGTKLKQFK